MFREIICIVGRTGYGKTLLARILSKSFPRVFGYVPMQDYDDMIYLSSDDEILNLHDNKFFAPSRSFRYGIVDPAQVDLWGSVYFLAADAWFIFEEFTTWYQRGQVLPPWLHKTIFTGRHRRLSLLISAQRAASIPIDARSQISRFITFNQREEADIKWLRESGFFTREQCELVPQLWSGDCLDSRGGQIWPIHRLAQEKLGVTCPHLPDPANPEYYPPEGPIYRVNT